MKIKVKLLMKKPLNHAQNCGTYANGMEFYIIPHDQSHRLKYHFPGKRKIYLRNDIWHTATKELFTEFNNMEYHKKGRNKHYLASVRHFEFVGKYIMYVSRSVLYQWLF